MTPATVTTESFDIGPCIVEYDGDEIGGTSGNVTVSFKYEKSPLKADQTGSALRDEAISGMEVTVTTEFLELRDKDKFKLLFPNANLIEDTPQQALEFVDKVATRMLPLAKLLTLHPIVEDSTDVDYDWSFFKAMPSEESEVSFSPTDQMKAKIVWKVYLDDSTSPGRFFRIGDTTLV